MTQTRSPHWDWHRVLLRGFKQGPRGRRRRRKKHSWAWGRSWGLPLAKGFVLVERGSHGATAVGTIRWAGRAMTSPGVRSGGAEQQVGIL